MRLIFFVSLFSLFQLQLPFMVLFHTIYFITCHLLLGVGLEYTALQLREPKIGLIRSRARLKRQNMFLVRNL